MSRVRTRVPPVAPPPMHVVVKEEGVLVYALQGDGTWKEFLGDRAFVPTVEVLGPDKESIALHLQDLRDRMDLRGTHNVCIHQCRWVNDKHLRVALSLSSAKFQRGREELGDVLLKIYEENMCIPSWVKAIVEEVGREVLCETTLVETEK